MHFLILNIADYIMYLAFCIRKSTIARVPLKRMGTKFLTAFEIDWEEQYILKEPE